MPEERKDLITLRQVMSLSPPTAQWENLLLLIGEDFQTYNPSRLVSAGDVLKIFKIDQGKRIVSRFSDERRLMAAMLPAVRRKADKAPAMAEVLAVLDQVEQWLEGGEEPDFEAVMLACTRLNLFLYSIHLLCDRPDTNMGPIIRERTRDRQDNEKQLREVLSVFPLHAVPEF